MSAPEVYSRSEGTEWPDEATKKEDNTVDAHVRVEKDRKNATIRVQGPN